MHSIGRNDTTSVPGLCTPTTATMRPSVAAMLYAGAVEETAITTLETSPSAPARRPLSRAAAAGTEAGTEAGTGAAAGAAVGTEAEAAAGAVAAGPVPRSGGATASAMVSVVMMVGTAFRPAGCWAMAVLYSNTILLYRFEIRNFKIFS